MHIGRPSGTKEGVITKNRNKKSHQFGIKRLATCNDIKETHVHIPSGIKYFTHTVLHYCRPHLIYCTEHDTKQDGSWRNVCRGALESSWCSRDVCHALVKPFKFLLSPLVQLFLCSFIVFSAHILPRVSPCCSPSCPSLTGSCHSLSSGDCNTRPG